MIIHFFQPELFNRTEQKTNPFFDPIIDVCRTNDIQYRVFIAEKKASPNGYRNAAGNSWILVWPEILGFRLIKWFHLPSRLVWRFLGAVMNLLTFGRYRADICITVAGVHMEILQGIAPRARLVDLQHGVIYHDHPGYFDSNGKLRQGLIENIQREYWLYGTGYKNVFFSNPENANILDNKVHIVGDVLGWAVKNAKRNIGKKNAFVFSMQLIETEGKIANIPFYHALEEFLQKVAEYKLHERYKVFLKYHPRHGNIDITDILRHYPWAESIDYPTVELINCCVYHFTASSTVAFEYAANGIPTLFLNEKGRAIFHQEFQYTAVKCWEDVFNALKFPEIMEKQCEDVKQWYQRFYCHFTEKNCIALLNSFAKNNK